MAERVAKWPEMYGIDGIDLDLEDGAGDTPDSGPNMIHFVKRLFLNYYIFYFKINFRENAEGSVFTDRKNPKKIQKKNS
jgi:hypothetical protein